MKKIVSRCPVCDSPLEIVELKCPSCGTSIHGNFAFDEFMLLDDESRGFLIEFLKSRGNIKELQSRLGISYPTAKSRLDSLLKKLGLFEEESTKPTRIEILEKLEKGEISTEDAIKLLEGLDDDR